jgi:hypothetical protein
VQEVLGEHQDSVVTRDVLRELGAGSSRAGQNGFTFGRLHGWRRRGRRRAPSSGARCGAPRAAQARAWLTG